jgi:hypothetical protein
MPLPIVAYLGASAGWTALQAGVTWYYREEINDWARYRNHLRRAEYDEGVDEDDEPEDFGPGQGQAEGLEQAVIDEAVADLLADPVPADRNAPVPAEGAEPRQLIDLVVEEVDERARRIAARPPPTRGYSRWSRWIRNLPEKPKAVPVLVKKYSQLAKVRFGVPQKTPANYMAVRDFIRQRMSIDDVRVADQYRYIDRCVEFTFVPNKYDLRAKAASKSAAARSNARVWRWLGGGATA